MKHKSIVQVKILMRRYLAAVLYYSGFLFLYRVLFLRSMAVILLYHRVTWPEKNDSPLQSGMYVTPEAFEMQMKYLSRKYNVIPLDELIEILQTGQKIRPRTCVITFDDGWYDTFTEAFPVLRRFHLPATVFVVTNFIETNEWFWPEKVNWLLRKLRYPLSKEIMGKYSLLKVWEDKLLSEEERIDTIIEQMKLLSPDKIVNLIQDLAHLAQVEEFLTDRLIVTWEEVQTLARHGFTVGSHSHNHHILTQLSQCDVVQELELSMKEITKRIDSDRLSFSYPNGECDEMIKAAVEKAAYICAVGTRFGFVKSAKGLFCLRRIPVHNDVTSTIPLFVSRVTCVL